MKKVYLVALLLGAFSFTSNAQQELYDDIESYNLGGISAQSPHWRTWSGVDGGADEANVVDDEALSGLQSILIPGNLATDLMLLVPSAPTSGIYSIQFHAYIPAGKGGYFNMQAALTPEGSAWVQALMGGNIFFNCDGASGGIGTIDQSPAGQECTLSAASFTYPEDQWFKVDCVYDLDNETWDMYIDDVQFFFAHPFAFNTQVFIELAGLDFYSATAHNEMYIDDVTLYNGDITTVGVDEFSAAKFSVYPNPVKDMLNIKSSTAVDNVTVYDLLGKVVLQENPGKISPAINMGNLASGSYLVKVTIGDSSKTVKVLK
ncbi:T9SS type A sorting domain-containing protein [Aequorivita sp. SDUM287046]|uniref:T9SS type A sorting domain-containing protein n=1 Tax=Aequorivita aurantiaca TaxID=3053356 RepID=A0ABT8DI94_9FLAO|nr:T9SS type A sorting domain-containing protein [Aequorivita aurantiaca]MDN3724632.1 T9SS type A sorting domain-containing protein [Aequorivita aurantiaca]